MNESLILYVSFMMRILVRKQGQPLLVGCIHVRIQGQGDFEAFTMYYYVLEAFAFELLRWDFPKREKSNFPERR